MVKRMTLAASASTKLKGYRMPTRNLLLTLVLSGCATAHWVNPDATDADFRRDKYACERDLNQSTLTMYHSTPMPFDQAIIAVNNQNKFFHDCMEARGYRWERDQR